MTDPSTLLPYLTALAMLLLDALVIAAGIAGVGWWLRHRTRALPEPAPAPDEPAPQTSELDRVYEEIREDFFRPRLLP